MDDVSQTVAPATPSDPWRWWKKLGIRAAFYAVALGALAVVAEFRIYPLTIVCAICVAVAGVVFHQRTWRPGDPHLPGPVGVKAIVFVLSIEIGALICASQEWRIFGRVGFFGLALMAFGIGQLMAEIRSMHSLRGPIVGLLWLNCTVALAVALALGIGGILLLTVGIVLALPAIALSSEFLMTWFTELNWRAVDHDRGDEADAGGDHPPAVARLRSEAQRVVSADPNGRVKTLRSPRLMTVIGLVGLALSAFGAVLLSDVGGWRLAVIVAVVVLLFVAMVSSNTDADVLVLLFAVAVVWTQLPRGTEAVPTLPEDATDNVVVLGDSYISGEGARSYFAGTNTREPAKRNECRQSTNAWAQLVFRDRPDMGLDFLACSGAKVANVSASGEGQYIGENPNNEYVARDDDPEHVLSQLERWNLLDEQRAESGVELELDWVFVSIGGNDAGFGDIVAECLAPGDCSRAGQRRLDNLASELEPRLDALYDELAQQFPSRVVVVPYPVGIVDDGDLPAACSIFRSTFTSRERRFVAGFTRQLDALIRYKAAEHGLRYVPAMVDVFTGRRICDTDRANANVNYIAVSPVGGDTDPSGWLHNSMHPNEHGHALMADAIEAWLRAPAEPEQPTAVARPSLSLTEVMDDGNDYCMEGSSSNECTVAPANSTFDQLRHAIFDHLPGILLVVAGGWLLALAALSRRHVARRPMTSPYTPWLSHRLDGVPTGPRRFVLGLFVIAVPTGVFFGLLNFVVALDHGYGPAQSKSGAALRQLDAFQLRSYYAATSRDLVWYIPAYVLFAAVLALMTAQRKYQPLVTDHPRAADKDDPDAFRYRLRHDLPTITKVALALIVATGAADVIETLLFRRSLSNLIANADADLGAWPTWTMVATAVKLLAALAVAVLVMIGIVHRRTHTPEPPTEEPRPDERPAPAPPPTLPDIPVPA